MWKSDLNRRAIPETGYPAHSVKLEATGRAVRRAVEVFVSGYAREELVHSVTSAGSPVAHTERLADAIPGA